MGRPKRIDDNLLRELVENRLRQNIRIDASGIAEMLGVNKSIVCRQLKRLGYTREVTGDAGSKSQLRRDEADRRIRNAIKEEDKRKPLSDPRLLEVTGLNWQVRMMTKARLRLGIGNSRERKKAYQALGLS